jgi:hypothetical protein
MVTIGGTRYSVPSHWKSLQAIAHVGAEDVRVVCGEEALVLRLEPDRKRVVSYRHYLAELAKKPQAVRQVSSQLIAELGSPFDRLWPMLADRYGEPEAARLIARLLGVLVDRGEKTLAEMIHEALERGDLDRLKWPGPVPEPRCVEVPEKLDGIEIESSCAAEYDQLLEAPHHG